MNKRNLSILLILVSLSVILYSLFVLIIPSFHTNSDSSDEESPIIPLNFLINNDHSALEQTKAFDRTIETFMRYWAIKGASFALMKDDSLIYAKGYGYANVEKNIPCNVNNTFRLASVSKLITATAVMKLQQDGRLSLSSQVFGSDGILNDSIFLDLRSETLTKITVGHLLHHTAGFSSPIGDPAFHNGAVGRTIGKPLPLRLDDMVLYATKNRLLAAPGQRYDYSNLGYIVLSKVIEKVSGMGYEEYVQDSILTPAGCFNMYIGDNFPEQRPANEVYYYETKEAVAVDAYDGSGLSVMKSNGGNDVHLLQGAGGWVASPVELLRFVASINRCGKIPAVISDKSIDRMTFTDEHTKPIGWSSVNSGEWMRSGSMAGTTALIKQQRDGYTWAFVANTSTWVGPRHSKYISTAISRALCRVSGFSKRDLFIVDTADSLHNELKEIVSDDFLRDF